MRITINEVQPGFEKIISSCIHETNAEGKADTLVLRLKDPSRKLDQLMIRQNDIIRIENGLITTGDMYIHACRNSGLCYEIRAMTIPVSGTNKKSKSWQKVRFFQLLREKANDLGLELSCYGLENTVFSFISQENETDMNFLLKICRREACCIIIFDRRLIVYSETALEAKEPGNALTLYDSDGYQFNDESYKEAVSCVVTGGGYSAVFTDLNAKGTETLKESVTYVESDSQALRYAKNILRSANKGKRYGSFVIPLDGRYAAGSVCYLKPAGSEAMKVMLTKVRYDYKNEKMKVFFREIFLEGY